MAQDAGNEKTQHHTATTQPRPHDNGEQAMTRHDGTAADGMSSRVATVALVGLGAALIEVELIPGMLIGVAAMLAPNVLPKLGRGLRPFVKGAVRAGYALTERAKETMAEAGEQLQDIVAEVRSEQGTPSAHPATGAEHPKHS